MRIVVTGGGGMLGHALVRALSDCPDLESMILTRAHGDLALGDTESVIREALGTGPSALINSAAFTDVNGAESHREEAWRGNCTVPTQLAKICAELDHRFIHVSTDYVFDGSKTSPYLEADPRCPINAYGASKADGELGVEAAHPRGYAIVRTSWLFGPQGRCFPATILRMAREGRPLQVVSDQFGSPTLTLHLAPMLLDLALKPISPATTGIFHGCNQGVTTWHGFASYLLTEAGLGGIPVTAVSSNAFSSPARRPNWSVLGGNRHLAAGLSSLPPWEEGVRLYLRGLTHD